MRTTLLSTDAPRARHFSPGRRSVLKTIGTATAAFCAQAPFIRRAAAAAGSMKIATFGGNFEDSFVKYIYPEFKKATGITVESVSEPGGLEFILQIAESNRAGAAPIDLCTTSQDGLLRGSNQKVWRPLNTARIPNAANLAARFVHTSEAGVDGIGAMAWYQTLIVNPDSLTPLPASWKVLWELGRKNAWGLASGGESTLFEVTAACYYGGNAVLDTEDGIMQVIGKIAELKPDVKVWWESEGTMQTAFENDEVIGGMYFHDVAGVMARNGIPIKSIFPKEGGVIDFGSWCQPAASTKTDEVEQFINFMCRPESQATLSRKLGTAPLVERKLTDLTDAEFSAVSSEAEPMQNAVAARLKHQDFMQAQFTKMLTS